MHINLENVSFAYPGELTPVLHEVNLTIRPGEWICLLGRTGSGKSTLLRLLDGLLCPTSGRILVDGREPWRAKGGWSQVRRKIGMIFQYPEHQLFADEIAKDVAFALEAQGCCPPEEREERVNRALAAMGLDPARYRGRNPFQLSGGEKRRIAIAGVLVAEPSLLVADEPTAGLDAQQRRDLLQRFNRWREQRNGTIITATHDINDFAAYAQRAVVLDRGRILYDGAITSLLASPAPLFAAGLCLPSLARLVHLLKEKGWEINPRDFHLSSLRKAILEEWQRKSTKKEMTRQ